MSNTKLTCSVCGSEQIGESFACANCGFAGAYYTLFSGNKAYSMWEELVDKHKSKYRERFYRDNYNKGGRLLVTGDKVVFYDALSHKAVVAKFNNDKPEIIEDVYQVSLSALYYVWIYRNKTMGSSGDDESGQRRVGDLLEITCTDATPKCTYALRTDGTITTRGATVLSDQLSKWTNIKSLAETNYVNCANHVIGIKNDGTVVCAVEDGSLFKTYVAQIESWMNVKKVVTTDYYALALHTDGTVSYAGANDEKAKVAEWQNISDIAADGQYAIGLTMSGQVLLAGDKSPLVDFGRSEASSWNKILYIATGRSVIAALTIGGDLKVVGNVSVGDGFETNFKDTVYSVLTNN